MLKHYSQEQLVLGFKKNDSKVLKAVYTSMYPKVNAYVLKNSGNHTIAKDIYQEAFIACWKNIKDEKFKKTGSSVEAYLYTIAKHKWTDHLRSATYKKTVLTNETSHLTAVKDEVDIEEDEEAKKQFILKQALTKLGEQCKTLLKLFYFERKSMNDISEVLKMTSASARNQKYRCMEKLKALSLELKNNE